MNEQEFDRLATDTISHIENALEKAIDQAGADVEYEMVGGILTIEFDNGSKIIVNKQGAAQQIWVAAKSGGFHYSFDNGAWRNDQTRQELFAEISHLASAQAGTELRLG